MSLNLLENISDEDLGQTLAREYTLECHRRRSRAGDPTFTSYQKNSGTWMKAAGVCRDLNASPRDFITAMFEYCGDKDVFPNMYTGKAAENAFHKYAADSCLIKLKDGSQLRANQEVFLFYMAYKTVVQNVATRHNGDLRVTDDVVKNTLMSPMHTVPPFYRCLFACNRMDMVKKYKIDIEPYVTSPNVQYIAEYLGLGQNFDKVVALWRVL